MSIDRAIGVAGLVATLIGGGLLWLWPQHRWIGWVFLVCGILVALLSTAWALSRHFALKEHRAAPALPASTQRLTQHAPITNNPVFAPRFEFNPQVSQQASYTTPRHYRTAPRFECKEIHTETRVLNLETRRLINEPYFQIPESLPEHLMKVDVVLARFYYSPNPDAEPWVYVKAHVSFYIEENEKRRLQKTVFDAIWYEGEEETSKDFYQASAHELIIALVPVVEKRVWLIGFEYATETLEGYWGKDIHTVPKLHLLDGTEFSIKIELIAKQSNEVKASQELEVAMTLEPKLVAMEIRPLNSS